MKIPGKVLVGLLCLILGNAAHAACGVTTTGINFGAYDVFAAVPRDTAGTVTVACDRNPPTDVTVWIGPSSTSGGSSRGRCGTPRKADRMNYNLFTTASMTTVWGRFGGGRRRSCSGRSTGTGR